MYSNQYLKRLFLHDMMQNPYLLDVFVNIDTDEAAPYICNYDNGEKIGHTFLDSDVRVFIIEATALQTFEHRLNLPSLPVHVKSFRSKGMKLWLSFLVLDFRPRCGVV